MLEEENLIPNEEPLWIYEHSFRYGDGSQIHSASDYLRSEEIWLFWRKVKSMVFSRELKRDLLRWEMERLKNFEEIQKDTEKQIDVLWGGDFESRYQFICRFREMNPSWIATPSSISNQEPPVTK